MHIWSISVLFHTHSSRDLLLDFFLKGLQSPIHISYTKYSYPCRNPGSSDRTFIHWVNPSAFIGGLSVLGAWNPKAYFQIWPGYWADDVHKQLPGIKWSVAFTILSVKQYSQSEWRADSHLCGRRHLKKHDTNMSNLVFSPQHWASKEQHCSLPGSETTTAVLGPVWNIPLPPDPYSSLQGKEAAGILAVGSWKNMGTLAASRVAFFASWVWQLSSDLSITTSKRKKTARKQDLCPT